MTRPRLTYAEHYRNSPYAAFPQEHRTGGRRDVALIEAVQQAIDLPDPPVDELVLVFVAEADDVPVRIDLGDGWTPIVRTRPGNTTLFPMNTAVRFQVGGPHVIRIAALPAALVHDVLDPEAIQTSALDPLAGDLKLRDGELAQMLARMWRAAGEEGTAANLLIDGLAVAVLGRLLELADRRLSPPGGALSRAERARVEEYLAARLEDTVRLADLAALLDLPPREASRLIREATGRTPHALLMERRVERARDLAVCTRMPLAEVAAACGFASQSHMTTLMRRRLGATPGQIRAAAR